jgi:hypothetical protein
MIPFRNPILLHSNQHFLLFLYYITSVFYKSNYHHTLNQNKHHKVKKKKDKKYTKRNHTNRLNGFLPIPAGRETVESTLKSPTD